MRGKEQALKCEQVATRITPAYAGKRPTKALVNIQGKDHPRVCGEKKQQQREQVRNAGSPPRMRGKD